MLEITIKPTEVWDEKYEIFRMYPEKEVTIKMEYSLLAIYKWESIHHKPYLSTKYKDLTSEEVIDVIRCMTITKNVDPFVYNLMTEENYEAIGNYISNPMTATTIKEKNTKVSKEILTAEIIYYWMIELGIPVDVFEKRNLNHLLTLIKVISIKRDTSNKMNKNSINKQNRDLNAARKAKLNTKG